MLNTLATAENQSDLDGGFPGSGLKISHVQTAQGFLDLLLNQVIDSDHSGEIDEAEMDAFLNVLRMSTMTSTAEESLVPTVVSTEVATLQGLHLEPDVEELTQSLLDEIFSFGEDVNPRFLNNKQKAIVIKRGGLNTFMTIYFRKYGFYVDCYCRNAFLKDKHAREIVKKICGKSTVPKAPIKIHRLADGSLDQTTRENCMLVARCCYDKTPQ